jgi:chemotaxis protein MotB
LRAMQRRLVVLVVALTAACGVNKATHQKALDRITALEGQLADTKAASAKKDDKILALGGELDTATAESKSEREAREAREADLAKAHGEQEATMAELTELRRQREAADARIAAFKALQAKFRELVDTGKLEVLFRNGQMVLKLPSGILFPSGSAKLSDAGTTALTEVAGALDSFKTRRFVIAGHTDNKPIKTKEFKNNWYLSTARAISVLEFLIDFGFPAKNLAAAGYGEQDPIAPNDTDANREQNRRIEIILVPNLEELPSLTGEQP